jgi:hypothetical protein
MLPTFKMNIEEAKKVVFKTIYRKAQSSRKKSVEAYVSPDELEASFRRSIDTSGFSIKKVVSAATKALFEEDKIVVYEDGDAQYNEERSHS